jgi:hypothetical protein
VKAGIGVGAGIGALALLGLGTALFFRFRRRRKTALHVNEIMTMEPKTPEFPQQQPVQPAVELAAHSPSELPSYRYI